MQLTMPKYLAESTRKRACHNKLKKWGQAISLIRLERVFMRKNPETSKAQILQEGKQRKWGQA